MKKAIIYGAGKLTGKILPFVSQNYEVLYIIDDDTRKHGTIFHGDILIKPVSAVTGNDFDVIVIGSAIRHDEMLQHLTDLYHISGERIISTYALDSTRARIDFLKRFARLSKNREISGNVAEVGVYRGDFASEINLYFPGRTLYLFDTFEGFSENDLREEPSHVEAGDFTNTSVEIVLSKMPHREACVVKKGFFPDTFDLSEEVFCFVNLDTDLYAPTLSGLRIFYPKVYASGGVILVHDYYSETYPGVKEAVDLFIAESNLSVCTTPAGDGCSIAVAKPDVL